MIIKDFTCCSLFHIAYLSNGRNGFLVCYRGISVQPSVNLQADNR
jgi:hypothetical protein